MNHSETSFPLPALLPTGPFSVLEASGADAADFLHKQLTQDVLHLGAQEVRFAGYCNNKGRMQASMLLWRHDADCVRLLLPAEIAPGFAKRLGMFILRSKVKLSITTLQVVASCGALDGLTLAPLQHGSAHGFSVLRLPDSMGLLRHLWLLPQEAVFPLELPAAPPPYSNAWLDVRAGLPWVTTATYEAFVPQMINFEAIGGVNFKKGCYPGQEVVARSQYLGKLKRRMLLAHVDGEIAAGMEVFSPNDPEQACGSVVQAAAAPGGGMDCLLELKLAFAEDALQVAGHALQMLPLPYPLPQQD